MISAISSFRRIENKYSFISIENKSDVYRSKDCMKNSCVFLRDRAMKIIKILENEVINKRAAGILWKWKGLLYLSRKNLKYILGRQKIS